jgi:hypothetical protein
LPQRFKSYAYIFMFQQTFRIYRQIQSIHFYACMPLTLKTWNHMKDFRETLYENHTFVWQPTPLILTSCNQ